MLGNSIADVVHNGRMLMKNGLNTLKIRQNVKSIQWRKCGKKKGEMNENQYGSV
jgi:hypothetical protein